MRNLLFGAILAALARAQIFHLRGVEVPPNRSLQTLHSVFVYAFDEAPERPFGRPFVEFQSLAGKSTSGSQHQDYHAVQLSLLQLEELTSMRDSSKFCCYAVDRMQGRCNTDDQLLWNSPKDKKSDDALSATVSFSETAKADTIKRTVRTTGIYLLAISNCGSWTGARIDGTVVVKHAYGFLPGNEYHKMPFYGWLVLVCSALAIIWSVVLIQWRSQVTKIQKFITIVVFTCLAEAMFWQMLYRNWNNDGVRSNTLFLFATILSVVKWLSALMFTLLVSLGWSITRPYLDRQLMLKIQAIGFFYIIAGVIDGFMNVHGKELGVAPILITAAVTPVTVMSAGILYWIMNSLTNLLETLQERQQQEKVALFRHFERLFMLGLVLTLLHIVCEIFDLLKQASQVSWTYEWMFSDGAPNGFFVIGLGLVMRLWAPGKDSQNLVYSRPNPSSEDKRATNVDDVFAEPGDDEIPALPPM